jgi:hypothetical protein
MWVVLLTVGLIKLPIAALMLWMPFRSDAALESLPPNESAAEDTSGEDDGGSKTLPGFGRDPDPHRYPRAPLGGRGRRPRRGPPGCAAGGRDGRRRPCPSHARDTHRGVTRARARQ